MHALRNPLKSVEVNDQEKAENARGVASSLWDRGPEFPPRSQFHGLGATRQDNSLSLPTTAMDQTQ